jgi:hypothetical protein
MQYFSNIPSETYGMLVSGSYSQNIIYIVSKHTYNVLLKYHIVAYFRYVDNIIVIYKDCTTDIMLCYKILTFSINWDTLLNFKMITNLTTYI